MAHHEMNTLMSTPEMVLELAAKPFRILGSTLGRWFENNALASGRMEAANKIAQMSDEELEELGMSRAFAVQVALRSFT